MAITQVSLNSNFRDLINQTNATATLVGDLTLLTTVATDVGGAINELDSELGNLGLLITDQKGTMVSAVNEVKTSVSNIESDLTVTPIGLLEDFVGDSAGDLATSIIDAINQTYLSVTTVSGDIGSFVGDSSVSVIDAINTTYNRIPNIYDSDGTLLNG